MSLVFVQKIKIISAWVKTQVSEQRFVHIRGVARTASRLASLNGLSPENAELAGWLHDCAKELPRVEMLHWIRTGGFRLDVAEKKIPALWHPHAGAGLALKKWGVRDKDILEAIRCHTLGSPTMSSLAQVVFVADFIEPSRRFKGVEEVRRIALRNLRGAVLLKCSMTISHLLENRMKVHGRLLDTWNAFLPGKGEN